MNVDPRRQARPGEPAPRERAPSFLTRLMDEIGSIWFGVTTMVLILVYCWLGSAGTQPFYNWFPRQTFELTEMEWFSWWPFQLLVGLLCLSLILVTLRKIRFNLPNLGVWTVHAGIIVLALGCLVYFGLKIEGDLPVYKRQVVLSAPGVEPVELPLQPGASATLGGEDLRYDVSVTELVHDYELRTGDDAGKTTYAAQLRVRPTRDGVPGQPFVRQLLDGYPQYTEDVLPGRGRAVKVTGEALVDDDFRAEMTYHDPQKIFLHQRRALHVRPAGTNEEYREAPLEGLPRYHEYMDPDDTAMVQPGEPPLRARSLRLDPEFENPDPITDAYDVAVTGYLPYAVLRETWRPGGSEFNPYLRFSMSSQGRRVSDELLALDPSKSSITVDEEFGIYFEWVEEQETLDRLLSPEPPTLTVRAPGRASAQTILIAEALEKPVPVEGTSMTVEVQRLFPRWSMTRGGMASMALVRVEGPSTAFSRAVIWPQKELSRDLDESGHIRDGAVDPALDIEVSELPRSGLTFVAGPLGTHVLLTNAAGQVEQRSAEVGERVRFLEGQLSVRIDSLTENARRIAVPLVVPPRERNRKARNAYSLVQVELRRGDASTRAWIEYSHYTHPSRSGFSPRVLRAGDGPPVELVYSRETHSLPAPVALEEFRLETYPGGEKERDYISLVRFFEDGEWSRLHEVRSNQPTEHAGWWYFQSTWDPPEPRRGYAGMYYTGLGVGNRHGVFVMLFGSFLTVAGTIWAFYVKPVILRQRREGRDTSGGEVTPTIDDLPANRPAAYGATANRGAAASSLEGRR